MQLDWREQAIDQLDWHWRAALRPRLDGLTDDEYLWEPAARCWSIRPKGQGNASHAAGAGDWLLDYALPPPDPAPVTTIAWRIGHLLVVFGQRTSNHFGDGSVNPFTIEWSPTAAGALVQLDEFYDAWHTAIAKLDDAAMAQEVGPTEGPWHDHPFGSLVLHINREVIHHGAEIALLRDLYRERHA